MGFFKGCQNNKKDVKSIFQQHFHCIIWQLINIPPTVDQYSADIWRSPYWPSVHHHTGKILTDIWSICWLTCRPIYWSIYRPTYRLRFGQYFDRYVNRVLVDRSVAMSTKGCINYARSYIPISRVVRSIHLTGWPTTKLTNWLTDWFTDLLNNWPTDWVTVWPMGWLVDWPTDWLINWLIDRLNGWLVDWLNDLLTYWLTDWLTHWLKQWHRFYTTLCHTICIDSTQCLILQGLLIDSLTD